MLRDPQEQRGRGCSGSCGGQRGRGVASLATLPPEVHHLIAQQLIYPDALSLKHTCRYFYELVNTGVRLKVEWLVQRRMLHLECPNDKRCDLGSDLKFCRGSVPYVPRLHAYWLPSLLTYSYLCQIAHAASPRTHGMRVSPGAWLPGLQHHLLRASAAAPAPLEEVVAPAAHG